eukprot:TRINITY_DN6998_c0_g1_i1.p2 TRINITY_DN6998_c0_g1~~TRINITY_DN6998_c0_g1_i1.p2  ORF type:complete len:156 (+),score=50.35 TRINITY_DN6998_c0_g1_i1:469-936(+)
MKYDSSFSIYDVQVSQYDGHWELPELRKFIDEKGQSAVSLPVPRKGQVLGSQNEMKRDVKRVEMKVQEAEQMQVHLRQELEKKQKMLDDQKLQLIAQKQFLEQQKKNLEETRKKQNAKKGANSGQDDRRSDGEVGWQSLGPLGCQSRQRTQKARQ